MGFSVVFSRMGVSQNGAGTRDIRPTRTLRISRGTKLNTINDYGRGVSYTANYFEKLQMPNVQ